ncbi:MAG: bacterioferritin [Pirellulales bacterium]
MTITTENNPKVGKSVDNGKERDALKEKAVGKQQLIDSLNADLAGELQAVIMYLGYSACLTGPYRKDLRALFQGEITDELGHAQFLADKIAALGGQPELKPRAVPQANTAREMLEQVLAAERQAIADYNERIEQADSFGDVGLRVQLENQISDETRHKEEVERILAGWDKQ